MLEKIFQLKTHNTNTKTEFIAGITTFLTMSYILALNPAILGAAGMDKGAVFSATCLAAILGTLIMAFFANWPVGLAPGMGLNGFFAYTIVLHMGYSWQEALGGVLISGLVFIVLTLLGIRKWITDGIPASLRHAITAGIGLFLAFLALKNAGIIAKDEATLITLGDLKNMNTWLMVVGFFFISFLGIKKVPGAIFLGILAISAAYFALQPELFQKSFAHGYLAMPPSLAPSFLELNLSQIFKAGFLHILLVLVLVELLDATACLIGIGTCGGLISDKNNKGLNRALLADSFAIFIGAIIGTSSTTAYAESAAGIEAGGRTGLTALTIALGFAIALFFSPIILAIPAAASAAALLFVACFMARQMEHISWQNMSDFIPALLTIIIMPLTLSIANGLAFGFISYVILKLVTGQYQDIKAPTFILGGLFILRYLLN